MDYLILIDSDSTIGVARRTPVSRMQRLAHERFTDVASTLALVTVFLVAINCIGNVARPPTLGVATATGLVLIAVVIARFAPMRSVVPITDKHTADVWNAVRAAGPRTNDLAIALLRHEVNCCDETLEPVRELVDEITHRSTARSSQIAEEHLVRSYREQIEHHEHAARLLEGH